MQPPHRLSRARALRGISAGTVALGFPYVAIAQSAIPIRIATFPTDSGGQAYYAQDLGFFKKVGLDANIVSPSSGSAIAAAVAGGAYDIGSSNTVSLATAHERGVPFVFLAAAARYTSKTSIQALVVAKPSSVQTAKDLNGKVIAVDSIGGVAWLAALAWVDQNGGDSKTVKFIELPIASMSAALGQGRVDAISSVEPFLSRAVAENGRLLANHFDAVSKDCTLGEWFAMADFVKTKPDVAKRFNDAMRQSCVWANANQDASAKILAKYTNQAPLPGTKRTLYADRLRASEIQPVIDVAVKYGLLKATFPASAMIVPNLT